MLYVEHCISDNNRMGSSSYVIHHTISDDYVSLPGSILSFLVFFFSNIDSELLGNRIIMRSMVCRRLCSHCLGQCNNSLII